MDPILGSDQNETRLFNHAIFVDDKEHWVVGSYGRFECDDENRDLKPVIRGDFWEIFVR